MHTPGSIDANRILTYPTQGPVPDAAALEAWLTDQGEAYEVERPGVIVLRALPVRLVVDDGVRAHIEVTPTLPLTRAVLLLAELGAWLRADVRLAGVGEVDRGALWLRFADLQDRVRLADAIARAPDHAAREALLAGLWRVLCAVGGSRDLRWDPARACIVEVREVGAPGGLTDTEAAWHDASIARGDTVAVPIETDLHLVAWRWLADAWPRLTTS